MRRFVGCLSLWTTQWLSLIIRTSFLVLSLARDHFICSDDIPEAAPPAQDAQAETNMEDLNGDDGLPRTAPLQPPKPMLTSSPIDIVNVTLKLPHEPFETKLQV